MLQKLLRQHRYELIAFLTGSAVMMLEIVGARLIAPYFGLSTYVWTAMIGVILGALALGYWWGGIMADRGDPRKLLGIILIIASGLVLAIGLVQASVLGFIADFDIDLRIGAFLGAVLLFAPASLLIGTVSPNLAKIRIESLETSGRSVGRLEAAGALGSIAGTFACGYFLLGYFGSRSIVIGVALLLLLTSFLAAPRGMRFLRSFLIVFAFLAVPSVLGNPQHIVADVDTSYARYQVTGGILSEQPARMLVTDSHAIQSAINLNDPLDPILTYVRRFDEAALNFGQARSVLVIGGGAYTFPSILVQNDPNIQVDVAEIDSRLLSLAHEYFYASSSDRINAIHEDGRTYLNKAESKYDTIFVDAYSSGTPPFQLTTTEAVSHMERLLKPDGVVVVNVIDDAESMTFLRRLWATYAQSFEVVEAYKASYAEVNSSYRQNIIMYASNDTGALKRTAAAQVKPLSVPTTDKPLTDDYAPIERLTY